MKTKQYEAMYLFDPTFASTFENCETEIRRLMDRAGAELVFCKKWDERRLAYKLAGRKRGVYVLTYFNGPADKIKGLERDVQLSEDVLRVLVLKAEGVTPDQMEKAMTAHAAVPDDRDGDGGFDRGRGRPDDRRPDARRSGSDAKESGTVEQAKPVADTKPAVADAE